MAEETDWWHAFFAGPWLEVQLASHTQEGTRADADWIERALGLQRGARVLDVPCGDGRIALELAGRGYQITGVDITEPLLDRARRQAAERGVEVQLQLRDMRNLPWPESFDAVVCYWGSFGYFDEDGNRAFLEAAYRTLMPGGRFLVETMTAETLLPVFQPRGWSRVGETFALGQRRYNLETARLDEEWIFIRGGQEERSTSSIRMYTYRELFELFGQAGFRDLKAYDTVTKEAFRLGSRRLTLVADKPA